MEELRGNRRGRVEELRRNRRGRVEELRGRRRKRIAADPIFLFLFSFVLPLLFSATPPFLIPHLLPIAALEKSASRHSHN